jgi:hypothetical protein
MLDRGVTQSIVGLPVIGSKHCGPLGEGPHPAVAVGAGLTLQMFSPELSGPSPKAPPFIWRSLRMNGTN